MRVGRPAAASGQPVRCHAPAARLAAPAPCTAQCAEGIHCWELHRGQKELQEVFISIACMELALGLCCMAVPLCIAAAAAAWLAALQQGPCRCDRQAGRNLLSSSCLVSQAQHALPSPPGSK